MSSKIDAKKEKIDVNKIIDIAKRAGKAILEIYEKDFNIEYKEDNSPLTEADLSSNNIIEQGLKENWPDIPIISEEIKNLSYEKRKNWNLVWIIDPLDGTKEFVKKNGEFTVNIGLVKKNKPFIGVVYAPFLDIIYYCDGEKSFVQEKECSPIKIPIDNQRDDFIVVASRSHMNKKTDDFIEELKKNYENVKILSFGSALKPCKVAEGKADIYPRLAPTMEWDSAAAHAIVNCAGKKMCKFNTDEELIYNKPDLLNPFLIVK